MFFDKGGKWFGVDVAGALGGNLRYRRLDEVGKPRRAATVTGIGG